MIGDWKGVSVVAAMVRRLGLLVVGALLFSQVSFAQGVLYKWADAEGVTHFTDRYEAIPPEYRKQANRETIEPGPQPDTSASRPAPGKDSSTATDLLGRDKEWWLAQKKHWQDEVVRLKSQIAQNDKDIAELRKGRVRQAQRTSDGILLNQGPRVDDYRELKWLQQTTERLNEELKNAQSMAGEGLIRKAYGAGVPSAWIDELRK